MQKFEVQVDDGVFKVSEDGKMGTLVLSVQSKQEVPTDKLSYKATRNLFKGWLVLQVLEAKERGVVSFTLAELLGTEWTEEAKPFYSLYESYKTAGREAGKLLGQLAPLLRLNGNSEPKHGHRVGITRYTFQPTRDLHDWEISPLGSLTQPDPQTAEDLLHLAARH